MEWFDIFKVPTSVLHYMYMYLYCINDFFKIKKFNIIFPNSFIPFTSFESKYSYQIQNVSFQIECYKYQVSDPMPITSDFSIAIAYVLVHTYLLTLCVYDDFLERRHSIAFEVEIPMIKKWMVWRQWKCPIHSDSIALKCFYDGKAFIFDIYSFIHSKAIFELTQFWRSNNYQKKALDDTVFNYTNTDLLVQWISQIF